MSTIAEHFKKNRMVYTIIGAIGFSCYQIGTRKGSENQVDKFVEIEISVYKYLDKLFIYQGLVDGEVHLLDAEAKERVKVLEETFEKFFEFKKTIKVDINKED